MGAQYLRRAEACAEEELRGFARLVRRGFEGSDETLERRIRDAHLLAFYRTADGLLVAIAGLKVPSEEDRARIFAAANAAVRPAECGLELGWVFVIPSHRGNRIGELLCRELLSRVPGACVFATTRPDNFAMINLLLTLGFDRVGQPFSHPRREEELTLFLRRPGDGRADFDDFEALDAASEARERGP